MTTRMAAALALILALSVSAPAEAQSKKALVAGIINVDGPSPITLVNKHGSDVRIWASPPGELHVEFDRVEDGTGLIGTFYNNTLEFEITIDGVPQPMHTEFFDILGGTVDVKVPLGLTGHQNVWINRIDLYDENMDRFATMGSKIKN